MPPEALPAYDRRNGLVVLVLALVSAGLWFGLRSEAEVSVPRAVTSAVTADSPLTLRVSGGWLRLAGAVPDDVARRSLLHAAATVFGAEHVIDQLAVHPGATALPWLPDAERTLAELKTLPEPGGIELHRDRVVLTGTVPAEFHRTAREAQARQWFGRGRAIDNQLTVAAPAVAAASALPAASAPPAAPAATAAPATPAATAAAGTLPAACQGLRDGVALTFLPGQPALAPAGQKLLATLRPCLGANGRWRVIGHTDANGVEARNVELTQQRAEAVKAALVAAGLAAERLEAVGLGSARPLADNASREGRLRNRRVSFEPL